MFISFSRHLERWLFYSRSWCFYP